MSQLRNRRVLKDRRQKPTQPFSRYMFFGRRQTIRRKTDRKTYLYVDRYSHNLLFSLLLITLLSVLDAYFTIFHMERGAHEINPLMNFLFGYGNIYFFTAKYAMTMLGVLLLCMYKNLFIARIGMVFILLSYLAVLTYHLFLTVLG